MVDIAILDFDGTIFSDGFIDIGLIEEVYLRYEKILVVSNNSSIAHNTIEDYLSPYLKYVLTPQVLAKAIFQNISLEISLCCSDEVMHYLNCDFYTSYPDIRNILKEVSLNSSNLFLQEYDIKKIAIIGKVDSKKLKKFINEHLLAKYNLVGMNRDKIATSEGISKKTNLVGDSYEYKYDLGKTSLAFVYLIKNYCKYLDLNPLAVFGDNFLSDGKLANLLGIDYKKTIFGKNKFSKLISIK
ncbi:MAG: hypothetical protein CMG00_00235 [Candidatus Marinimicrobia bacterium]|nr:hypothetical protein [Candidatus Neomarinimicrobiota bacterium]|tara:strand:+ start:851 stop:1576 length:726 start_codon:yes stop_codon:yes gene_type:complete